MNEPQYEVENGRIILSEKTDKREKLLNDAEILRERLLNALLAWTPLGLILPLEVKWLWDNLVNPNAEKTADRIVREILYNMHPDFKKLPIKKEAALGMLEMPAKLPDFIHALKLLNQLRAWASEGHYSLPPIEYYEWDNATQTLSLHPLRFATWLDSRTRRYANETEAQALVEIEALLEKLQELEERYPGLRLVGSEEAVFFRSSYTKQITIDTSAIRLNNMEEEEQEEEVLEETIQTQEEE